MKIDGKFLYQIREKLGYKKTDMCVDVGISLTALTNIERGLSDPRPDNQKKITKFLKTKSYPGDMIITK